jgi:hypothetical protein
MDFAADGVAGSMPNGGPVAASLDVTGSRVVHLESAQCASLRLGFAYQLDGGVARAMATANAFSIGSGTFAPQKAIQVMS